MKHQRAVNLLLVSLLLLWPGDVASGEGAVGPRPGVRRFSVNIGFEVGSGALSLRGVVVLGRNALHPEEGPGKMETTVEGRRIWARPFDRARRGWTVVRVVAGTTSRVARHWLRERWRNGPEVKGSGHADRG